VRLIFEARGELIDVTETPLSRAAFPWIRRWDLELGLPQPDMGTLMGLSRLPRAGLSGLAKVRGGTTLVALACTPCILFESNTVCESRETCLGAVWGPCSVEHRHGSRPTRQARTTSLGEVGTIVYQPDLNLDQGCSLGE
jgi:hypothetical protein